MLNATLTRRIDLTPDLYLFQVRPDAGFKPFSPGQYVAIGLPNTTPRPANFPPEANPEQRAKLYLRTYSIASPSETPELEFYITTVPTGVLTPRLSVLQSGDRLYVAPKITGTFTLHDVPEGSNLVFVSTGTGIAPFMSMLRTPSTLAAFRSISLLHGVRYPSDLAYREELEKLAEMRTNFHYYPVISRPTAEWVGDRGYVQALLAAGRIATDPAQDHVFLCGNPAMIDEVEKLLFEMGYKVHSKHHPGSLHVEKYW